MSQTDLCPKMLSILKTINLYKKTDNAVYTYINLFIFLFFKSFLIKKKNKNCN